MDFEKLLWFGGSPGETMPGLGGKIARHSKGNRSGHKAERPNQREINKGRFSAFDKMEDVAKGGLKKVPAGTNPTGCLMMLDVWPDAALILRGPDETGELQFVFDENKSLEIDSTDQLDPYLRVRFDAMVEF